MPIQSFVNVKKMILILGAGFIGKSLFDDLTNKGYKVKLFSRNLSKINDNYCQGNIAEIEKFADFFDGVSTIIHTIHTTVPSTSFGNEIFDVESNIIPFIKLINLCKKKDVKKFIYISTGGAIYGTSNENAFMTEDFPTNPISPYGITKLANEKFLLLNKNLFTEGLFILRPSNIYGIGQKLTKPQGIIPHLINSVINSTQIEIWGDGTGKKDYLFLSDFLNAIQKTIDTNQKNNKFVYNVGFGESISINEIIKIIERSTKNKISIKYTSNKNFDIQDVSIDSALFKKTFDWNPINNAEKGIERILDFLLKPTEL